MGFWLAVVEAYGAGICLNYGTKFNWQHNLKINMDINFSVECLNDVILIYKFELFSKNWQESSERKMLNQHVFFCAPLAINCFNIAPCHLIFWLYVFLNNRVDFFPRSVRFCFMLNSKNFLYRKKKQYGRINKLLLKYLFSCVFFVGDILVCALLDAIARLFFHLLSLFFFTVPFFLSSFCKLLT